MPGPSDGVVEPGERPPYDVVEAPDRGHVQPLPRAVRALDRRPDRDRIEAWEVRGDLAGLEAGVDGRDVRLLPVHLDVGGPDDVEQWTPELGLPGRVGRGDLD